MFRRLGTARATCCTLFLCGFDLYAFRFPPSRCSFLLRQQRIYKSFFLGTHRSSRTSVLRAAMKTAVGSPTGALVDCCVILSETCTKDDVEEDVFRNRMGNIALIGYITDPHLIICCNSFMGDILLLRDASCDTHLAGWDPYGLHNSANASCIAHVVCRSFTAYHAERHLDNRGRHLSDVRTIGIRTRPRTYSDVQHRRFTSGGIPVENCGECHCYQMNLMRALGGSGGTEWFILFGAGLLVLLP